MPSCRYSAFKGQVSTIGSIMSTALFRKQTWTCTWFLPQAGQGEAQWQEQLRHSLFPTSCKECKVTCTISLTSNDVAREATVFMGCCTAQNAASSTSFEISCRTSMLLPYRSSISAIDADRTVNCKRRVCDRRLVFLLLAFFTHLQCHNYQLCQCMFRMHIRMSLTFSTFLDILQVLAVAFKYMIRQQICATDPERISGACLHHGCHNLQGRQLAERRLQAHLPSINLDMGAGPLLLSFGGMPLHIRHGAERGYQLRL